MNKIFVPYFIVSYFFFFSCSDSEESPTNPIQNPRIMLLENYMTYIDSSYFKVWSDSSWEKFNKVIRINNIDYVGTINNLGNEYYYTSVGYAGFKPYGESLIIFNQPLNNIPDTILFNYTYKRETTFYFQGYSYTLTFNDKLIDTVSVDVPFGTFNPCLWLSTEAILSAGGQSDTQNSESWLAIGPGAIKVKQDDGIMIVMVRGVVNGQSWGMYMKQNWLGEKHLENAIALRNLSYHSNLKVKI